MRLLTKFQFVLLAVCCGCESRPQAPVLRNSPVYQSETEGFRFRVPDGWSQTANSTLPSGEVPRDVFLARYSLETSEGGASLQVLGRNDVPSAQLVEHLSQPAFGVEKWELLEPPIPITVDSVPAERLVLQGLLQGKPMIKHATCFHRNARLYTFVGMYSKTDQNARQQIERAVDSLLWE
ncbi:MAG: hypothetical protein KDA75_11800 [Planctomycetaceae bacterium]|nr:hypothetical protein [Planctomycetaceae bacterium]